MEFKGKRIEIEYQKTISTQMISAKLQACLVSKLSSTFKELQLHSLVAPPLHGDL